MFFFSFICSFFVVGTSLIIKNCKGSEKIDNSIIMYHVTGMQRQKQKLEGAGGRAGGRELCVCSLESVQASGCEDPCCCS